MAPKIPSDPLQPSKEERLASKDERLAKALRENLARRKALARAKRERAGSAETATAAGVTAEPDPAASDTDDDPAA